MDYVTDKVLEYVVFLIKNRVHKDFFIAYEGKLGLRTSGCYNGAPIVDVRRDVHLRAYDMGLITVSDKSPDGCMTTLALSRKGTDFIIEKRPELTGEVVACML